MNWWLKFIRREKGPLGTAYICRVCGHAEHNRDKTAKAWGRIRTHVAQTHPEQRLINKGRTA
jgi:hypothetical protein